MPAFSSCLQFLHTHYTASQSTILTLFLMQILTQEDWNYVLYLAMRYTSHWAAIYFIALMTFGNYVLFNLLVAILVEGFSDDEVNVSSTDGSKTGSDNSRIEKQKSYRPPGPGAGQRPITGAFGFSGPCNQNSDRKRAARTAHHHADSRYTR